MNDTDLKNFIKHYNQLTQQKKNKIIVVIVGGVVEKTKIQQDYKNHSQIYDHSIASEFYNMEDITQMRSAFEYIGIETLTYYEENEFIQAYFDDLISKNKTPIVLHFSPNGIYTGRHSLIYAFCEKNNILHTGSNPYLCSLARDKYAWYKFLKDTGIRLPKSFCYDSNIGWIDNSPSIGTKIICKLTHEASGIGLGNSNVFEYSPEMDEYIKQLSLDYKQRIIVQKFIFGIEIEVPVLSNKTKFVATHPVWMKDKDNEKMNDRILNHTIRNSADYERVDYSTIHRNLAKELQDTAITVAQKMGFLGLSRLDFRVNQNNKYYLTDLDALPHMNYVSTIVHSFGYLGLGEYHNLLGFIIGVVLENSLEP